MSGPETGRRCLTFFLSEIDGHRSGICMYICATHALIVLLSLIPFCANIMSFVGLLRDTLSGISTPRMSSTLLIHLPDLGGWGCKAT